MVNEVQRREWVKAVEHAKEKALKEQKVKFVYPDQEPFKQACMPLHQSVLSKNVEIREIYDRIQEYNEQYPASAK